MSRGKRFDGDQKLNKRKVIATVIGIIVVIMVIVAIVHLFTDETEIEMVVRDSYYVVLDDDKYGVIDNKGDFVIKPTYDEMIIIPNNEKDVFIVTEVLDYGNEEYTTKVLNKDGKEIFKSLSNVEAIEKSDVNSVWYDSNILTYMEDGLYGLVDIDGNVITENIYTDVYALDGTEKSIVIENDDGIGIVNSSLESVVIDCMYSDIKCFSTGEDDGYITNLNGSYGVQSASGKEIISNNYKNILPVTGSKMYVVEEDDGLFLINEDEEKLIDITYDDVTSINGDNLIVEENEAYGIINSDGEVLLDIIYDNLTFAEGENYIVGQSDAYGVINIEGETKVDLKYNALEYIDEAGFYQGENDNFKSDIIDKSFNLKLQDVIVSKINLDENYIRVKAEDGLYKYYTLNFEEKENIDVLKGNTLFLAQKDGKYGFKNSDGELIVDYIYDDAQEQNELGFIAVKKDGLWGVLDSTGVKILDTIVNLDNNLYISFIGEWHLYEDAKLNIFVRK